MNYLQKKKLAFMSIVNRVKGFVRTITGALPLTLEGCVDEESIIDYTLYGQSVQDGTPAPEAPVEVESVGEKTTNLINWDLLLGNITYPITKVDNGYYSKKYFNAFEKSSNLVKHIKSVLKPNITYTLSRRYNGTRDGANGSILIQNSASENIVECRRGEGLVKVTFALTQEQIDSIDHLYIYFHNNGGTITNLQLTESDTVLPCEPYGYKIPIKVSGNHEPITTNIYLDEPLRKVGDYADYIDFENGKVIRNIKKYTFTGNEDFQFRSHYNNETYKFSLSNVLDSYVGVKCMSNIGDFENGTNANATGKTGVGLYVDNKTTSRIVYMELPSPYNSPAMLQQYLSENKTYVIYALATPTETSITLPNLPTFKGTSIISADTTVQPSNVEITYYSNVKE